MTKHLFSGAMTVAILSACANVPGWDHTVRMLVPDVPLAVVTKMNELEEREKRDQLASSVHAEYKETSNNENALRLALVRSLPNHHLSDDAEALVLLEAVDETKLSKSARRLKQWLASHLKYRLALREENREARDELQSVRNALSRAREKIEILTRIEQTTGPDSESQE